MCGRFTLLLASRSLYFFSGSIFTTINRKNDFNSGLCHLTTKMRVTSNGGDREHKCKYKKIYIDGLKCISNEIFWETYKFFKKAINLFKVSRHDPLKFLIRFCRLKSSHQIISFQFIPM